ncbi:MAG: Carbamoyl-phosphate synthase chain ATP-binding, partial [Microbacteriaceae bacterium]|nr:Carbamoyl-phosphate synthase chain ATP-binding [Microbacteriaceae bacterium]
MEMNTRLQVEHPVTEMVTGIDLVEWQLRIAAGEPLTIAQDDVTLTGHAVEARVYAENPGTGFLPSAGTVLALEEPSGPGIRVDSSLAPGLEIGSHYDPMLAKVIAHGATRGQALDRLGAALESTTVLGVETNIEFLGLLIGDADVRSGALDTGLIARWLEAGAFRQPGDDEFCVAALWLHARRWRAASVSPWSRPTGWRLGRQAPTRYRLVSGDQAAEVLVTGTPDEAIVTIGADVRRAVTGMSREHDGGASAGVAGPVRVELDGLTRRWRIAGDEGAVWLADGSFSARIRVVGRRERVAAQIAGLTREQGAVSPEVRVPMPGTVVALGVASGDRVEAGQLLVTVEAMKMEHRLLAGLSGTATLTVSPGEVVALDQLVATITPSPSAAASEGEQS